MQYRVTAIDFYTKEKAVIEFRNSFGINATRHDPYCFIGTLFSRGAALIALGFAARELGNTVSNLRIEPYKHSLERIKLEDCEIEAIQFFENLASNQ